MRAVAVFDADLPPGVAFLRSLGQAGVPVTAYASSRLTAGRFSRYAHAVCECPPIERTDDFVPWLREEIDRGAIDLIAPTSDHLSFCATEALEKLGRDGHHAGLPDGDALRTCLFKDRFAAAMGRVGFPTPTTVTAGSVAEALLAAEEIGYPVVIKPRTHVGVGPARGLVAATPEELAGSFVPYALATCQSIVLRHDPDLALPVLQHYHELGTVDVVSVTGCLGPDGELLGLGHCRKVSQSPRRLGVGTMFEPLPHQPFTDEAVDVVRHVLGSGVFELEVLVDRGTQEVWAVDLNPRAFGQISLDIALGNDLPALWYRSVTGEAIPTTPPRRRVPRYWHEALSSYVGFAVRIVRGSDRGPTARHAFERIVSPSVRAMFEWHDPVPGLLFGLAHLRHPRAFLRPFLVDTEHAEHAEPWPADRPPSERPADRPPSERPADRPPSERPADRPASGGSER